MTRPDVELLWWEGCPSTDRALAELRRALADLGLSEVEIVTREIRTDAQAHQTEFRRLADDPDRRRRFRRGV